MPQSFAHVYIDDERSLYYKKGAAFAQVREKRRQ